MTSGDPVEEREKPAMNGLQRTVAVALVAVGLFTLPTRGGLTPFPNPAKRSTAGQETNIVNGGGGATQGAGGGGVTGAGGGGVGGGGGGTEGKETSCPQFCPFDYTPVCGSDGVTYTNPCTLSRVMCLDKPNLTAAYMGPCDPLANPAPATPAAPPAEGAGSDAGESRTTCREDCPKILAPVCGSDGTTYSSVCQLQLASCLQGRDITMVSEGSCGTTTEVTPTQSTPEAPSCSQQCTRIFLPVCGSDGVTYNNLCLLKIADCESRAAGGEGVSVASEGVCGATAEVTPPQSTPAAPSCSQQCTRIFLPVCGSDGVTYNSLCLLKIADCESRAAGGAGVSLASEGACGATTEVTPPQSTPAAPSCSQQCTRIFVPVCGSDGVTYNSLCLLKIADCESRAAGGAGVSLASEGACEATTEVTPNDAPPRQPTCSEHCARIFLQVCGSDGVTYNNLCLLKVSDCENRAAGGAGVSLTSEGPCGHVEPPAISRSEETVTSCRRQCTTTAAPVCGSDGVTYENECLMEDASCRSRSDDGRGIYLLYTGACDPRFKTQGSDCRESCSAEYEPVCGSDGVTYDNECQLDASNCGRWARKERGAYLVKEGPCDSNGRASPELRPSLNTALPSSQSVYSFSLSPQLFSPSADSPQLSSHLADSPQLSSHSADSPQLSSHSADSPQLSSHSADSPQLSSPSVDSPSSPQECSEACTKEFRPVCGSDGLTYNNPCALEVANCKSRARGALPVEKNLEGPCVAALPQGPKCDAPCDRTYRPVCGSDGETYNNDCLLKHADCLNPFASITPVHDGPCPRAAPAKPGPAASLPSLLPVVSVGSSESLSEEE